MDSAEYRRTREPPLSQADLAEALGLGVRSKGYVSRLEAGAQPWPLRLALKYQQVSGGLVRAADLCAEAGELLGPSAAEARP